MATTGIWKIEKRIDHVIKYVSNPDKTVMTKENYRELHNLNDYEELSSITEEGLYISGVNCIPEDAFQDMMDTKKIWKKCDGVLGYHAFQSFKEGEVSADKAHLIGVKLAEEIWGDRFEVLVTTHINTNHIHNHFVINSVSFMDGKKYNNCHENYALIRHTSDALCEEYGLSVLDNSKIKVNRINYENFYQRYVKKNTYYSIAKQDIDRAIGMAYSYKDFENIMIKMGYEIKNRYGKLTIKREPYKKNIRIERAFGDKYSIESIEKRIDEERITRVPFIEAYNPNNYKKTYEQHKANKAHGIYGLYKYYCYILGVYPKENPNKILTPALRVEANKLDEISKQTQLLVNHKIETYQQLSFYNDAINEDVNLLLTNRENLWRKYKRTNDESEKAETRKEIDTITELLEVKRKEVVLCEGIEKRSGVIEDNIKEFEEEKEKGEIKR